MLSQLVRLSFEKVMPTRTYTAVVLVGEGKRFAIYTDPSIGRSLQLHIIGTPKQRPLTHDLMDAAFRAMDIKILQVVIVDIQDTVYFARLFLEQYTSGIRHIAEIDARPSDCITLALMNNIPVYCTREVLDKTIPIEE
jgi:bifunctional DNase/RNase